MGIDRRRLLAATAFAGAASATGEAQSAPARDAAPRADLDAAALGVRPNIPDDQTQVLQRAIEQAAAARAVLRLPPGVFRAGSLQLSPHTAIAGVAGATRLVMTGGPSLMFAADSDHVSLRDLVFDGANIPLPERRGLLHFAQGRSLSVVNCTVVDAGRYGVALESIEGEVTNNAITGGDVAIFSIDARGLRIANNTVRDAGNGGILVWRSAPGDDGTLVVDNRIDNTLNKSGGSGEYGNAINVFRADNVIVRGNRVRNAAFSAVRGNAASNMLIAGNTCTGIGEVALYAEFGFQGALIANNIIDGAALGVSVTNFNKGGRLAVVQGNIIRNLAGHRPAGTDPNDIAGVGIGVEADTMVTGNVIENAPNAGIAAGWGAYLRDVSITSNLIRRAEFGITVSVAPGAGAAVIAGNMIADVRSGAIVGMEWKKAVSGDLAKDGAAGYPQLSISGNHVR
jgi:uncharacterized secreted repeat protein (TIGR03808 family)